MITKCIKVTIKKCCEIDKKSLNKIMYDIQYQTWLASNRAITYFYTFTMENMLKKEETGENIDQREIYGKTYGAWVENRMNEIMNICNTRNVAQTKQFVSKRFNDDKRKGLLKGNVALTNFKRDMPILIHNNNFKISQGNKGYQIECSLFNLKYQKENNIGRLNFLIDSLDGNKKSTLNKLITGTYKQGTAQIIQDKKGKWYFIISFSFKAEKKKLDTNKTLGVDLGITNTATMQIWDDTKGEWERLSWKECVLDGKELIHYRQKIEQRYYDLLKNCKVAADGRTGHGRMARIRSVDRLREKISNFRDTLNHKYSKYIVDFAVKHNCGTIQLEDLTGFNPDNKFLKQWAYYDLQQKIQYKAEEIGIVVKYKNPYKTSQRCSQCGCISSKNRDCQNNQARFKCVLCGFLENADINASRNISLPNIEELIKEQLKVK